LSGGKVESHSKARTFKKAVEQLKSLVIDEYPLNKDGHLSIMHADNLSLAEDLSSYFTDRLNIPQPQISFFTSGNYHPRRTRFNCGMLF